MDSWILLGTTPLPPPPDSSAFAGSVGHDNEEEIEFLDGTHAPGMSLQILSGPCECSPRTDEMRRSRNHVGGRMNVLAKKRIESWRKWADVIQIKRFVFSFLAF